MQEEFVNLHAQPEQIGTVLVCAFSLLDMPVVAAMFSEITEQEKAVDLMDRFVADPSMLHYTNGINHTYRELINSMPVIPCDPDTCEPYDELDPIKLQQSEEIKQEMINMAESMLPHHMLSKILVASNYAMETQIPLSMIVNPHSTGILKAPMPSAHA